MVKIISGKLILPEKILVYIGILILSGKNWNSNFDHNIHVQFHNEMDLRIHERIHIAS